MVATSDLVSEQFDLMQSIAVEFVNQASALQASIEASIIALSVPEFTDPSVTIPSPVQITREITASPETPTLPESSTIAVADISGPGAIVIDIPEYEAPDAPDITSLSVPGSSFPNAPAEISVSQQTYTPLSSPDAPAGPALNSISIPSAPILTFPTEPLLTDLVFPSSPAIATVSFDGIKPDDAGLDVPENFTYDMSVFQHNDVWNAILSKIESDLEDGATGLDPTIEAAIYQRHKDRQQIENDRIYRETEDMYGAAGFNLPTGAMVARLSEIKAEIARKEDDASLDIMVKQADLAQNNSQFAIEKGIQISQMLQSFYIQSEDLTFRIALETRNKAIEIFNAKVAFYNVKLDAYKTEASVYASRLQGELTKIEAFKSEVTAIGIQADAQKTQVDIYTQKLSAIEIQSRIYTTQLEGTKVELGLENLKIESYKAMVEAYTAELNAENINVEAFKARIEAENSKVEQYSAQVEAYKAAIAAESSRLQSLMDIEKLKIESSRLSVEKYQADIQAALASLQAQVGIASAKADIYNADSSRYNSLVSAQAEISRTESANYSAQVNGISQMYQNQTTQYTAEVQAKQDYNRTLLAEMQTNIQYATALLETYIKQAGLISDAYIKVKDLQINGELGAMNAATQLAASAMNAVNTSASQSISSSTSETASTSDDYSESHNYHYEG